MKPHTPEQDRLLRRVIADVGALGTGEIKAILAALGNEERQRVESLLSEYSGSGLASMSASPESISRELERSTEAIHDRSVLALPDWLCARALAGLDRERLALLLSILPKSRRSALAHTLTTFRVTQEASAAVREIALAMGSALTENSVKGGSNRAGLERRRAG